MAGGLIAPARLHLISHQDAAEKDENAWIAVKKRMSKAGFDLIQCSVSVGKADSLYLVHRDSFRATLIQAHICFDPLKKAMSTCPNLKR